MRALPTLVLLLAVGTAAACGDDVAKGSTTSVEGTVVAGPSCAVEQPSVPCPPGPVTEAVVEFTRNGDVAAKTSTDSDGAFSADLADGDYEVRIVVDGPFPSCPTTKLSVSSTVSPRPLRVECDSGIRAP